MYYILAPQVLKLNTGFNITNMFLTNDSNFSEAIQTVNGQRVSALSLNIVRSATLHINPARVRRSKVHKTTYNKTKTPQ